MEIVIKEFSKKIKGYTVLDNINFTFESGQIYGLFGRNGSGKTMLLRAICGFIRANQGEIRINNERLGSEIDFPRSIGAIIEQPNFYNYYSGYKNLEVLASLKNVIGKEEIAKALDYVGLDPNDRREVRKYSLGMKQRLAIAQAIMESPDILLFDEPTNALDDSGVCMFQKMIEEEKSKGKIIIIATHNKEDVAKFVDIKLYMNQGVLTREGTTEND